MATSPRPDTDTAEQSAPGFLSLPGRCWRRGRSAARERQPASPLHCARATAASSAYLAFSRAERQLSSNLPRPPAASSAAAAATSPGALPRATATAHRRWLSGSSSPTAPPAPPFAAETAAAAALSASGTLLGGGLRERRGRSEQQRVGLRPGPIAADELAEAAAPQSQKNRDTREKTTRCPA